MGDPLLCPQDMKCGRVIFHFSRRSAALAAAIGPLPEPPPPNQPTTHQPFFPCFLSVFSPSPAASVSPSSSFLTLPRRLLPCCCCCRRAVGLLPIRRRLLPITPSLFANSCPRLLVLPMPAVVAAAAAVVVAGAWCWCGCPRRVPCTRIRSLPPAWAASFVCSPPWCFFLCVVPIVNA